MSLRALRKAMVAFATFDSVTACRACAMQNSPSRQSEAAPPEAGAHEQTAEGASREHASRADATPETKA
jgi:hypothetical protein